MKRKQIGFLVLFLFTLILTSCANINLSSFIKSHEHVYGEWNIYKEASCLENGIEKRSCLCGEYELRYISKLEHNVVADDAVFPTCDTNGLTEGSHCSVCNTVIVAQITIPAFGHSYNSNQYDYCEEDGHAHTCIVCGGYDVLDHTSNGEATETKSEICTECGYIINPSLGHEVHNQSNIWGYNSTHHWYKCEGCEAKKYDFSGHNLSEYEIDIEPTSLAEGSMSALCVDGCGYRSVLKILKTPTISKEEDGLTISWDSIDYATGYYLYNGDEFIADLGLVLSYTSEFDDNTFEYNIVAYTTNNGCYEVSNHSNVIRIGFECDIDNLQAGLGTDFEGFNPIDHASLYPAVGKTISSGWKTDANGVKAFAIQANYQAVALAIDPDDSNNTVLRVQGGNSVTRVALNLNQSIQNEGTYKLSVKVRLGTEKATEIGRILLRLNKYSDRSAEGAISDSIFFSESDDTDSILSASEWTTLSVVFTVDDDMAKELSIQELCAVFIVYTNNNTNGLGSSNNHILIDDFEIHKINLVDVDHQHTYDWKETETATCVQIGVNAHYYCEGCGKYFDENKNQISYKSLVVDKLEHSFDDFEVIKEATVDEEGIVEFTCLSGCNEKITVNVLKTPNPTFVDSSLLWDRVDNAEGYYLYNNDEFVCDLGNVLEYEILEDVGNYSYQIEAYTNDSSYYDLSSKSKSMNINISVDGTDLQEGLGTNFEGFNPIDHASLYPTPGNTVTKGWKTDANGVKVFGVQSGYQAVALSLDPDNSNNSVLRVQGTKNVTRVALKINQTLQNAGIYMAKIKVRLGTEESTNIGRILLRLNKNSDISAEGAISDSIFFSVSDDTDSILSVNGWTTLTAVFSISEEMAAKLSVQDICAVFIVYTNNDTNGLGMTKNYILIDDFEMYKMNLLDTDHPHTYNWNEKIDATCEQIGINGYYYCEICGNYFDENKNQTTYDSLIIEQLSHSLEWNEIVEPTCEQTGVNAHYYCVDCGNYFDEDKNQIEYDLLIIEQLSHSFEEHEIIKEATIDEEGIIEFTCLSGCNEKITAKILKTPNLTFVDNSLLWNSVDNAEGYSLYNNDIFVCDLGDVLEYKIPLTAGNYSYSIEAYTNNNDYYKFSFKSESINLDITNLQEGYGTDFEGYSPETHPKLFDESGTVSATSTGTWYADSNGENALGIQSGYKVRLVEEDGNVVLKVGGKNTSKLIRVGLNMSGAVNEAGTYVAKIKIKRGPNAVIPKFFFKINQAGRVDKNTPLSYYDDTSGSGVTGIFFKNESDPDLSTDWVEYSVTFTVAEGSTLDNSTANNFCAAFVMYMGDTNSSGNHYILIDDFEIYKVNVNVE